MAKLTLTDFTNLSNETAVVTQLNNNFAAIEQAIENTLSRDGTTPNSMNAHLDMNNFRILNAPAPIFPTDVLRKQDVPILDVPGAVASAQAAAATAIAESNEAAASAAAAAVSEANANISAQQAAALAGPGYGVNVGSPVTRTTSFTMTATDMGVLQILAPAVDTTLDVQMPPAGLHLGKLAAFLVPASTLGLVRFTATPSQPTSLVLDYPTDNFFIWAKEEVTLIGTAAGWEILDWKKNPCHANGYLSTGSSALSTTGAGVEFSGWTRQAWDATYLRHSRHAWDFGTPNKMILPRRGVFQVQFDTYVSWTGTAPTSLYAIISPPAEGLNARDYGFFISATQWRVSTCRVVSGNRGVVVAPTVYCTGGTSPTAQHTSVTYLKMTELV